MCRYRYLTSGVMRFRWSTSYAGSGQDLAESMELIRQRAVRVADMISHRLPLAETGRGFQLAASGQDSIKIIIDPLM